jgi:uncharacterized RDD family membrane protein YckC
MAQPPIARTPATVHDRVLAGFVDLGVLVLVFVVVGVLFGGAYTQTTTTRASSGVHETAATSGVSLTGGRFGLFVVLCLVYYFACEMYSGQTIGKRAMGLRVVDIDGGQLTARAVFIRTVGRIVDVLPLLYLLGVLVLASSKRHQRIGDRLARTTVSGPIRK